MPKQNNRIVRMNLLTVASDPIQYKPYNPVFSPDTKLVVEIPVIDGSIVINDEDTLVLDIDAFKCLLIGLSNMIDEADKTRQNAKLANIRRTNR